MKKCKTLLIAIVLIFCLSFFISCATAARWQDQYNDTSDKDISTLPMDPSSKYIVYAGLNDSGTDGQLISSGTPEAYAVVGYTGGVAELVIPATYGGLPVTKVLAVPADGSYPLYRDLDSNGAPALYTNDDARLQNQTVVTSIIFGSNVRKVGAGVCAGMVNLKTLSFTSMTSVTIDVHAFDACPSLTEVRFKASSAVLNGNFSSLPAESIIYSYTS